MRPGGAVSLPCSQPGAAIRLRRSIAAGRRPRTRTVPTSVFVPGGWENDIRARAIQWERVVAATPARRWFGGRGESQRAEAQAAKDAAAAAFYELDTAQRDLRISIETITAVDNSPAARRAAADFAALGQRIDQVSHDYISAVDAHDLDHDGLDAAAA